MSTWLAIDHDGLTSVHDTASAAIEAVCQAALGLWGDRVGNAWGYGPGPDFTPGSGGGIVYQQTWHSPLETIGEVRKVDVVVNGVEG